MKKDYSYSTSRLLKDYTDLQNKYISIMQTKSDSNVVNSENADAVKSKALELGAKYYLLGSLNRMGEVVIVSLSMYETANGTRVWVDKLKAQSPDDLDPILLRLAQNLGTANKAETNDDIYSITSQEQQELKKKQATNNFGVGLCALPMLTHGYDFSKNAMLSGFSFNWSFDARDFIFDIKPYWCFNTEYDIAGLSLEMIKPLTNKANSPFWNAGAAFSLTDYKIPSDYNIGRNYYEEGFGNGMMLLAGGGYIFNRTSSVSVRISANYFQGFYDVKGSETNYLIAPYSTKEKNFGMSAGIMMRIEILFRK